MKIENRLSDHFSQIMIGCLVAFVFCFPNLSYGAAPAVTVGNASGTAGAAVNIPVTFSPGTTAVATLQFDLSLPAALSYGSIATGAAATAAGKSAQASVIAGGIRVVVFGLNQTAIGSGTLATITFNIAPGTTAGNLAIGITGIVASDPNGAGVSSTGTGGSVAVTAPVDTTPPTVPTNLVATVVTSSQINLSWNASTDNVAVTGYKIFRNGAQVGTTSVTLYQDTGLTPSTTYTYTVSAFDAAGNNSIQSSAVTATTQAVVDTVPPTVPTNLVATAVSSSQINLAWSPSTDNVGVSGYKIFRNGVQISTSIVTSYSDTGLSPSTSYSYTVSAFDAAGNNSDPSSPATATTLTAPDTTPPSVPTGLVATVVSSSQINLTWNASTDNVGVTGYKIYRNSVQVGTSTVTSYQDTGLSPSTSYTYTVSAFDAAGNNSGQSASASATTSAVDTTPLTISGVVASVTVSGATITWTTNKVADSQVEYGTTAAYGSASAINSNLVTLHVQSLTGLLSNTLYHYRVKSRDNGGNLTVSPDSTFVTAAERSSNGSCLQGSSFCLLAQLSAGGGVAKFTSGEGSISAGYGAVTSSAMPSIALANFGFTQNGVLVTEVGVPASPPVSSARIFVDAAAGLDSGVAFVNPGDSPITVTLDLRNQLGVIVTSSSLPLDPKGHTARFVSQLVPGTPNPFLGTLTLSSTAPFAAADLRSAINGHGETLFSALPLTDLINPPSAARLIFPQVVDGGGSPTQLLLLNPSNSFASKGTVSLYDDNGNPLSLDFGPGIGIQSTLNYSLAPNGMAKFSTTGSGSLRVGYAVVTPTSGPLPVGSGVFSINGASGLSSQASLLNAPETTAARMFVEGTSSPLSRNTGIAIVNRNNVQALVNFTLQNPDGSTQSQSVNIGPNGHLAQFVTELFPGLAKDYHGVMTINSNVPVASLILRLTMNQRGESLYSTLSVADLNNLPVGPLFIPQIVNGGGYQAELILLNGSGTSGTIQVEFFDDRGGNISFPLR